MGKQDKAGVMSILTIMLNDHDAMHELMNDKGTVIATVSEEMKDRMVRDGVPEVIIKKVDTP